MSIDGISNLVVDPFQTSYFGEEATVRYPTAELLSGKTGEAERSSAGTLLAAPVRCMRADTENGRFHRRTEKSCRGSLPSCCPRTLCKSQRQPVC